jgi:hypothetical protein
MDVDVYRDVAVGDRCRSNGRRSRTDRWYRIKLGIWISTGAFDYDLHAAMPRVITQKGVLHE